VLLCRFNTCYISCCLGMYRGYGLPYGICVKEEERDRIEIYKRGEGCDVALQYRCSTVQVPLPCYISVFSVIWSEEIRPREALWLD
jgi:hypothetical protein